MPRHTKYFPLAIPQQIPWLINFIAKLTARATDLGYLPADIASVIADATWALYCLEKVNPTAKAYGQAMTVAIKANLYSPPVVGSPTPLPGYALPTPIPTQVAAGALRRMFEFIAGMKERPQYKANPAIGEDLGVIGEEVTENPDAVPRLGEIVVRGGEVIIPFYKDGRMGVCIECSVDGGPWEFVTIDTTSPYNDARPVTPPKTAEKRRYRLCFWDGEPTNVWVTTEEIAYGG